jgi:uncharacterized protein (DUF1499 family)
MLLALPPNIVLLAAAGLTLAGCGILLSNRGLSRPVTGWALSVAGGALTVLAVLLLVLALAGGRGPLVLVAAGVALLPVGYAAFRAAKRYPRINDISTDVESPPVIDPDEAGVERHPFPRDNAGVIGACYPELRPLIVTYPPFRVLERARAVLRARPEFGELREGPEPHTLRAAAVTPLFRFRDLFVLRIAATSGGARVDARSCSLVGRSDFGANALRIRSVLRELEEELR